MFGNWLTMMKPIAERLIYIVSITAISFSISGKARADERNSPICTDHFGATSVEQSDDPQNYNYQLQGCSLSWVERGKLRSIAWQYYENDFAAPILSFSPPSGYTMTSQRPPRLIDVDYDGSRDLVTFNEVGGTNGDFDIFLYDADRDSYAHAATMFGSYIDRDESGQTSYLVAGSRNGARPYFRFYEVSGQEILPAFDVDPQEECAVIDHRPPFAPAVRDGESNAQLQGYDSDLIEYYCNIYDKTKAEDRTTPFVMDDGLKYLPSNTIFYCLLDLESGLHAMTITQDSTEYRYSYGPLGADPDLVLGRGVDDAVVDFVDRRQPNSRRYEIRFKNGAFTYTAYGQRYRNEDAGISWSGSLVVTRDGLDKPVFSRDCNENASFDILPSLWVN